MERHSAYLPLPMWLLPLLCLLRVTDSTEFTEELRRPDLHHGYTNSANLTMDSKKTIPDEILNHYDLRNDLVNSTNLSESSGKDLSDGLNNINVTESLKPNNSNGIQNSTNSAESLRPDFNVVLPNSTYFSKSKPPNSTNLTESSESDLNGGSPKNINLSETLETHPRDNLNQEISQNPNQENLRSNTNNPILTNPVLNINGDMVMDLDVMRTDPLEEDISEKTLGVSDVILTDPVDSDLIWTDPVIEEVPDTMFRNRRMNVPDRGFPEETKESILKIHNIYRGNVTPPAANMALLEWDTKLEHTAQVWADGCSFKHGKPPSAPYPGRYGQNLYIGADPTAYLGMWMWFDEYHYYNLKTQECEENRQCGHYVTMAFAESKKIGCGVTKCGLRYLIVCHYFPGAMKGQQMYTVGKPCSQCPKEDGSLCLRNLCVTWDQCDGNSKLCDDAECNLKCLNCGRLDRDNCQCECADGWDSADCSRLCADEHVRCGMSPGFPNPNTCSLSSFSVARKHCRKMCQSCKTYGNQSKSNDVCCNGKFCEIGHILDTESCSCKLLCPGPKCDYTESSGKSIKNSLINAVLLVTITQLYFYVQFIILK